MPSLKCAIAVLFIITIYACKPGTGLDANAEKMDANGTATSAASTNTDDTSDNEDVIGNAESPTLNSDSKGGLPTAEEAKSLKKSSTQEMDVVATQLTNVTAALNLNFDGEEAELVTSEAGDCDGMFCIARIFGGIFDMVMTSAKCNIHLLLGKDANTARLNKIVGEEVYYVDGFGSVNFDDKGRFHCSSRRRVRNWARHEKLLRGKPDADFVKRPNEFYPPARIVITKTDEFQFKWKVVFFPSDLIKKLVGNWELFKKFETKALDFNGFVGHHTGTDPNTDGHGTVSIHWSELARMIRTITEISGDDPEPADDIPTGTIKIDYNFDKPVTSFTTTFLDQFSIGDDANKIFINDQPTTVYGAGDERYIYFHTGLTFGEPEEEGGDGMAVQFCADANDLDSGFTVNYGDVNDDAVLATSSESHYQLLWRRPADRKKPRDFHIRMNMTQGGHYIYGPVSFESGHKADATERIVRINAPRCEALTDAAMTKINALVEAHLNGTPIWDEDGYFNMYFRGGDGAFVATKTSYNESLPVFERFKLIDPLTEQNTDAIILKENETLEDAVNAINAGTE